MKKLWFTPFILVLFTTALLAEKKEVTIKADDGFALKGSLYSAAKSGPGILLLHQCNADRQIYDQLGAMLSTAGYNVLALDFRGFGGSAGPRMQEKWPADVDAAIKFLGEQTLVNKTLLGVVGGSCGVNQAIQAARRHPEVRTLVLLSGGTDADGEGFIKSASKVPIFGAASEEDTNAAASIRKIVGLSTNRDSQLTMLKDAGHAASMFAKQPDLEPDIVIWFRSNLPVSGYATAR
jgi:pimeloyl-ACP methyl ester carboxylesterase